jgi:deoxyadenosine/deoxycytidine kinase
MDHLNYIVIEGNIGAGKTTLATMLAEKVGARLFLEQFADNPFLPKFYEDQERYSFPLELSFLAERYNQLNKELRHQDLFHNVTISDYFFMKCIIFAKSTLADDEFKLYSQIFDIIYKTLPKPDIYVYLHLPVDKLLKNIVHRGRDFEQTIKGEYLEKIQDGYFSFFKQHPEYKFLVVETENLDFVANPDHFELLRHIIFDKNYSAGINRVLL